MSRWILCGGLFINAAGGLLSLPGISGWSAACPWLVGGLLSVLPSAYKLVAGTFGVVCTTPPVFAPLPRLPLFGRSTA